MASKIIGNINSNEELSKKYAEMKARGLSEVVALSRLEAQRVRIRKTTDKGSEVAIVLESSRPLRRGDILQINDEEFIEVEIEPEDVAVIKIEDDDEDSRHRFETAVRVGHVLGNLHRPIRVEDSAIYVPIQAESEVELLSKRLSRVSHHVNVTKSRIIFEPDEGADEHTHA